MFSCFHTHTYTKQKQILSFYLIRIPLLQLYLCYHFSIPLQEEFGSGFSLHSCEVVEDNIKTSCSRFFSTPCHIGLFSKPVSYSFLSLSCALVGLLSWSSSNGLIPVCQHFFYTGEPKAGSSTAMTKRKQSVFIDSFEG